MKPTQPSVPMVVYGSLRSGTTLLRLMLDNHPELSCPGESDFMFDHLLPGSPSQPYNMTELQADRFYHAHEDQYLDKPLTAPTPNSFVHRITDEGTKTPILVLHRSLSRALDIFPDMRVVHLLRDPRDVARSSIGMGWAGHVYYGVDHWMQTENEWQVSKDRLDPSQILEISYEDLVQRAPEVLGQIAEFAGRSYHADMLEYDGSSSYSKPDPNLAVQWKTKQSAREVGLVEAKIGPLLKATGHETSGHPQIHPSAIEKTLLWLKNKRAIWAVKIARFGLKDSLILAVGNRLGLSNMVRNAQTRIDEKAVKYIK